MIINGLQKLTLLDYPGRIAATVFLGGCNFRCPFCHNASLVVRDGGERISEEELFQFLESRRGKLSGVCITGGEPTLRSQLPSFIRRIKEMGFAVKLDTNGSSPHVLASLINDGLLDYVAMDIKSSREGYAAATGIDGVDLSKIDESLDVLRRSGIAYELRTTLVRELHTAEDMISIGRWIKGAPAYYLQGFKDSGDLISAGYSAHDKKTEAEFLELVRQYVPTAQIRG